jgi:D-tyrosyl-tRNA(Tyr) deacylase
MAQELRHVGCGVFGAHMEVSLVNNGPVTIVMDSEVLKKKKD